VGALSSAESSEDTSSEGNLSALGMATPCDLDLQKDLVDFGNASFSGKPVQERIQSELDEENVSPTDTGDFISKTPLSEELMNDFPSLTPNQTSVDGGTSIGDMCTDLSSLTTASPLQTPMCSEAASSSSGETNSLSSSPPSSSGSSEISSSSQSLHFHQNFFAHLHILPPVPLGVGYPMSASFQALISDIFENTKFREHSFRALPDYLTSMQNNSISESMRFILVDWLSEVCLEFKFNNHSFHLAINYLDRFLSKTIISKETLQLCGAVALMIAAKYNEKIPPCVDDYVYVTDFTFSKTDFLKTETLMLNKLDFRLCATTHLDFIYHYLSKFFPLVEDSPPEMATTLVCEASPGVTSPSSALPPSCGSAPAPSGEQATTQTLYSGCNMSTPPSHHHQPFNIPFRQPQHSPDMWSHMLLAPSHAFREQYVASLSIFLSEIILLNATSLKYSFSKLSACCVVISLLTFNFEFDPSLMAKYTGYSFSDLSNCLSFVYDLYCTYQKSALPNAATRTKFLQPSFHHIASLLPQHASFAELLENSSVGSKMHTLQKDRMEFHSSLPQTPHKTHSIRGQNIIHNVTPLKSARISSIGESDM